MAAHTPTLLPLLLVISLLSLSSAHNITRLLSNYPDFSIFNSLLASTDIAAEINSRRTITVLAVPNSSLAALAGCNPEIQRFILSVHVILDYFDLDKLHNLKKRSAILTTLFQTSGIAEGQTGFLNVTTFADGRIAFGSAEHGAGLVSDLVGSIANRPYNISVLQVSSIIIPPGMEIINQNSTIPLPPPPPSPVAVEPSAPSEAPVSDTETPETISNAPVAGSPMADSPMSDTQKTEPPAQTDDEAVKSDAGRAAVIDIIGVIMAAFWTTFL